MRTTRSALAALATAGLLSACGGEQAPALRAFDTPQALAEANRVAAESRRSVTVDLDLATNGTGTCGLRTSDFAASCEVATTGADRVAYVMAPDGIFVKIPRDQAPRPDKPWLRIDPADPDNALSRAMAEVAVHIHDTADIRKALPEGARIVEKAEESVDGTRTVRYTAHVPAGGRTALITLWVDDQDLPVRTEVRTPVPDGEPVTVVARYRDWGTPVRIDVPTPDQLTTLPG